MTTREVRTTGNAETRAEGEGATRKIGGYAAVFNTKTDICGCFIEVLAPGCFAKTLKTSDVRALFNHDRNFVLGRQASKTLELSEDDKGLSFEATPPDASWARDLAVSIGRGDINECSFAFISRKEQWDETGDLPVRTILEADLYDVSVVTIPAYPDTSASLRMFEARSKPLVVRGSDHTAALLARAAARERGLLAA